MSTLYDHPCANFDMYVAKDWNLDLTPEATVRLQYVLSGAKVFHQKLFKAHQNLDQDFRDRMLVIAGVGYKTLFRVEFKKEFWGLWEHTIKEMDRIRGNPDREGDGRVPLSSAALENVPLRFVKGVHGGLANIPAVYN